MPYGTVKVDNITFTNAGSDQTATVSGIVATSNGTFSNNVTARAFIPTGSTVPTNGVYLPSSNNVAISTNGTQRLLIQADGDINIDSGGVFYDATNNRLGIGTTSPGASLDVCPVLDRGLQVSGNASAYVQLTGTQGTTSSNLRDMRIVAQTLAFGTGAATGTTYTEKARITEDGKFLVGTSTARAVGTGNFHIQSEGTGAEVGISTTRNSNSSSGSNIRLVKSRGLTAGSNTIVQSGDSLGVIGWWGTDGTNAVNAANISAEVDGTPGANDMPGRLVFSTTADGASSPTERMRIREDGNIGFFNTPGIYPNTDNAAGCGFSGFRWTSIYAVNGTIQTSDGREKSEVTNASLGAEFIKALRPVSYKWIEGGQRDTGERDDDGNYIYESVPGQRTHWGFIAQEVKEAVDAAGVDFGGWVLTDKDDPDSQQALRYDQFIAPLTKALQEALAEIDVLKAKVAALEAA